MTRTDKLRLFTWTDDDPVNVEQISGNFATLDGVGRQAAAALTNQAEIYLYLKKQNVSISAPEMIHMDLLDDQSGIAQCSNVCVSGGSAALPPSQNVNRLRLRPSTSGTTMTAEGMLSYSLVSSFIHGTAERTLATFTPKCFFSVTDLALTVSTGASTSFVSTWRLKDSRGQVLWQSVQERWQSPNGTASGDSQKSFTVSLALSPNETYSLTGFAEDGSTGNYFFRELILNGTEVVPTQGELVTNEIALPVGASRLLLRCNGSNPPTARMLFGQSYVSSDGQSSGRLSFAVPDGAQSVQIVFLFASAQSLDEYLLVIL